MLRHGAASSVSFSPLVKWWTRLFFCWCKTVLICCLAISHFGDNVKRFRANKEKFTLLVLILDLIDSKVKGLQCRRLLNPFQVLQHLVRKVEIVPDLISIFTAQIHVISPLQSINVLYFVYVVQLQSNRLSFDVILLIELKINK